MENENHRTRDTRAKRPSGIEEQKTLHEKGGPLTSILMNREVKVGPRVKVIAETSAYRTEGKSLVVLYSNTPHTNSYESS